MLRGHWIVPFKKALQAERPRIRLLAWTQTPTLSAKRIFVVYSPDRYLSNMRLTNI
jgi:hypothetical protein